MQAENENSCATYFPPCRILNFTHEWLSLSVQVLCTPGRSGVALLSATLHRSDGLLTGRAREQQPLFHLDAKCRICLAATLVNILGDAPDISFSDQVLSCFKSGLLVPPVSMFPYHFPKFSSGTGFCLKGYWLFFFLGMKLMMRPIPSADI